MLYVGFLFLSGCLASGAESRKTTDTPAGKRQYQIQDGPCSYTFLLPEQESCRTPRSTDTNLDQEDDPAENDNPVQRLEQLENIMGNNTQWLQKLESYIQDTMKQEMLRVQQDTADNHTAAMLEMGTNLLSQTAAQTHKLTSVEAQVINHTTRLERQLLENSVSTNKLEKQLIIQTHEISKLNDKTSYLEKRVGQMEEQREEELKTLKEQLSSLVLSQAAVIQELEIQLVRATSNNSALQRQQQELLETVNHLISNISVPKGGGNKPPMMQDTPTTYPDCGAVYKSGNRDSGVYSLNLPKTTQEFKAYCDMETEGGGWTVLQKRFDGNVDFHRTWKEYKIGFGNPSAEYWLGNEIVSILTNQQPYVLRIQMTDWENNTGFSQYDQFSLGTEVENYRIHFKGYSGTAGKISSLAHPGNDFSTKDADNDKCVCKCSQLATGGWWFEACGPSNLNGVFFQQGQNSNRFNGIKWYYWKGSGYSMKSTAMMIRPVDF